MTNPWLDLPKKEPYVLDIDKDSISDIKDIDFKIFLNIFPDPYVGDINNAEVFFLLLNPGLVIPPGLKEPLEFFYLENFPSFKNDLLANLHQEQRKYPFYYLDPKNKLSLGFRYWTKVLNQFLNDEVDYEKISKKICAIEFFPYHSQKYKKHKVIPSQKFTFEVVKEAINRNKIIIVMRAKKDWEKALELKFENHKNIYFPRSSQNVILTKKNIGTDLFEKLKEIFEK